MKKIALIVGNSGYPHGKLRNPVNDANSIEQTFNKMGIYAIKKCDIGIADFKDELDDFREKLTEYEVAIFFFAGHGLQIDGENFLCAIDTEFTNENRVKYTSVDLNYLIDILNKSSIYTKIIILDACRDNPFENNFRSVVKRGLAPISAPIGTIISFSTSPGETARDGSGANGAYTSSLLQHIETTDLKIEEVFKRTRNTLFSLTNKKQLSWEHTSLMGDFYFCVSTLTGEYQTNYSKNTLEDNKYNYLVSSPIMDIINNLRSHDWDKQNPAINRINRLDLSTSSIDDLIILGRNIYQVACGPAWNGREYINNLRSNLSKHSEEVQFHILNGMAYEIYFDHAGKLRKDFKNDMMSIVINILTDLEFRNSAIFISEVIRQYNFRVIYDVLSDQNIVLNINCRKVEDNLYQIENIFIDGKNVLYNYEGSDEYQCNDKFILYPKERIINSISNKIAAPTNKVSVYFPEYTESIKEIGVPYDFQLLYHPIKDTKNEDI